MNRTECSESTVPHFISVDIIAHSHSVNITLPLVCLETHTLPLFYPLNIIQILWGLTEERVMGSDIERKLAALNLLTSEL